MAHLSPAHSFDENFRAGAKRNMEMGLNVVHRKLQKFSEKNNSASSSSAAAGAAMAASGGHRIRGVLSGIVSAQSFNHMQENLIIT